MPILAGVGSGIYYNVIGEGIPLVFIHPPLLTSANFKYQVEELSQKYKVITFDIRGHGQSGFSKQPITYQMIANDITQLLDHLKIEKSIICGYSTGGTIVLEFMLTHRERALAGVIISGMSEVNDFYNEKRIVIAKLLSKIRAKKLLGFAISWGNSNTFQIFKHMYREALKGDTRNIAQYYNYCLHYNCTQQLHSIVLPTLLIYGSKDKAFHRYAKILHEILPHNELKIIHEKHQIPTKAAKELNQLIDEFVVKI
ncbi:alpha/beta fold hydrolase [Neobacillus sp. NPDC058068]|uniref:alpha/beta fold hydrolase n=1 Tax=Neobacillus sp. NPDC058068 TaxID=3346325 RepID=UPI0036D8F36B